MVIGKKAKKQGIKRNINFKGRLKRLGTGILFTLITLYTWFTLQVNSLTGFYKLVLIVPLFVAILSLLETVFCYCVLKDKRSKLSIRLYAISLVASIVLSSLLSII